MKINHLTISQDGQLVGSVAIRGQAVNAAKTRAARTGKPVSVIAHIEDGSEREVIFNPDGLGQVYINRGGGRFRCIAPAAAGPMFYNAGGGFSNASGVFQNIESGWTFTAKGIIQYIDGTIEWDHSVGGEFKPITA